MAVTPPSDRDKSGRCQVRISLSERDGRLWEWVQLQPEKARARQMTHLMWLGLSVAEAMSPKARMPDGAATSGPAHPVVESHAPTEPAEPTALRALADFNVDAFDF
jgi:hypothetical protein